MTIRFRVSIESEKCMGCGDCAKSCVYGVLEIIDDIAYPVDAEKCKGCRDSRECPASQSICDCSRC